MCWVVGLDSYRGFVRFRNVPYCVTICVNNRICNENSRFLIEKAQSIKN